MPQIQLPIFPNGVTNITSELAFKKERGQVMYFNGSMPVFVHDENDIPTFRMITSQFCVNGNAKQADISRAFGIPVISVKRAVKLFRERGPQGFYAPRRSRGPAVLTPSVLKVAQERLDEGRSVGDVAEELKLKSNTVAKAVRGGRLQVREKKKLQSRRGSR